MEISNTCVWRREWKFTLYPPPPPRYVQSPCFAGCFVKVTQFSSFSPDIFHLPFIKYNQMSRAAFLLLLYFTFPMTNNNRTSNKSNIEVFKTVICICINDCDATSGFCTTYRAKHYRNTSSFIFSSSWMPHFLWLPDNSWKAWICCNTRTAHCSFNCYCSNMTASSTSSQAPVELCQDIK